jgi:hypothetical protein
MKGRKWNGREGRRDWKDIREEKGRRQAESGWKVVGAKAVLTGIGV